MQAQKLFQVETLKEIWDGRADGVVHWRRFFGVRFAANLWPELCLVIRSVALERARSREKSHE